METTLKLILGFAFGMFLGFCVQRAGLCFAHGLGEIYMGRGKRIARMFLVIFIITGGGFLLSGYCSEQLGLKPIGLIRGYGLLNLVSGMIFGGGILLNGGCILGTLRQIGEGNLLFVIVLLSFIPGMALVVYMINPALKAVDHVDRVLLPAVLGVSAPILMVVLILLAWGALMLLVKKK
jgi:hypothetical protein